MASSDQSKSTTQVISPTDIVQPTSSLSSLQTNIKWKDVCEENAKSVAEKLFNSLFIDHSISIPPDLTLSIIIEQFYQILRDKLKELVQNKISDWEIRYPSLLLASSGTLSIKNENEAKKDLNSSSLGFSSNLCTTNQLYLASGTATDIASTNSEGNVSYIIPIVFFLDVLFAQVYVCYNCFHIFNLWKKLEGEIEFPVLRKRLEEYRQLQKKLNIPTS